MIQVNIIEPLEERLLLSVTLPSHRAIAQRAVADSYTGSLHVTSVKSIVPAAKFRGKNARPTPIAITLDITSQSQEGMLQGTISAGGIGEFTFSGIHRNGRLSINFQDNGSGVMTGQLSGNRLGISGSLVDAAAGSTAKGHFTLSAITSGFRGSSTALTNSNGSSSGTGTRTSGSGASITIPTLNAPTITIGNLDSGGSSGIATGGLGFASTLSGSGVARGLPGIGGTVTGVEGGTNGVDTSVSGTSVGITGLASGVNGTATGITTTVTGISSGSGNVTTTNNTVVSSTTPTTNVNAPGTVPGLTIFPTPTAPVVVVGGFGSSFGSTSIG